MAGLDDRTVNETCQIAGNEYEELGRVAEAVVTQGQPGNDVVRNMIEKDHPQPDAAKQVEPDVALDGYFIQLGHDAPSQLS